MLGKNIQNASKHHKPCIDSLLSWAEITELGVELKLALLKKKYPSMSERELWQEELSRIIEKKYEEKK